MFHRLPFFELNNREREVSLILQLSDSETREWFNKTGYKIIETDQKDKEEVEVIMLDVKEIEVADNTILEGGEKN